MMGCTPKNSHSPSSTTAAGVGGLPGVRGFGYPPPEEWLRELLLRLSPRGEERSIAGGNIRICTEDELAVGAGALLL